MTILSAGAALAALFAAGAQVGQQTTEQAGAALAAGRPEEAVARSAGCMPDAGCALVRGRALFALGNFAEAAKALHLARSGEAGAHAAKLEGESLVLAGQSGDAREPPQAAAQRDPEGPAGRRAAGRAARACLGPGRC